MISADTSAAQRTGLFLSLVVQSLRLVSKPSAAVLTAEMFHFVDPIRSIYFSAVVPEHIQLNKHTQHHCTFCIYHKITIIGYIFHLLASRLMANVSVVCTNGFKIKSRLKCTVAERKRDGNVK